MKHLLLIATLFFSINITAQEYTEQWEKIIKLEQEGNIKKASAETEKLYSLAKKDRNEVQLIRVFFFRSKYIQVLQDNAQVIIVNNLKKEITTASIPGKALLQSIYAETLQNIYNRDSYTITRRTNIDSLPGKDILTWTTKDFTAAIKEAYTNSISQREVLYKTPLNHYADILEFNPLLKKTNRSLYDFLLERYINSIEISYYPYHHHLKPDYHKLLLGYTPEFINVKIADSLPEHLKRLITVSQQAEAFYAKNNDVYSLQRLTLQRLQCMYSSGPSDLIAPIYIERLTQLATEWGNSPFAFRAKLKSAQLYSQKADKKEHPDFLPKALNLCKEIIANPSFTDAIADATTLMNSITAKSISLQTQKYVAANAPFLAKVYFKNTDTLKVRFYKVNQGAILNSANAWESNYIGDSLKNKKTFLEKSYILPRETDYFEYSTEIILPPLPKGLYVMVSSSGKDHAYQSQHTTIQATGITLTDMGTRNKKTYRITDFITGKPIENATATFNNAKFLSNANGTVAFDNDKDSGRYVVVQFTHDGDTLTHSFYNYNNYSSNNNEDDVTASANIYLDRAIYRPGQTVYFKGIVSQVHKGIYSVVPNVYVNVEVTDANYKTLKEFRIKTNEFGSFTDEFTLPANALTGEFEIAITADNDEEPYWENAGLNHYSRKNFKVEDYKRPTFAVTFNPLKGQPIIEQEVTVSGNAKAFSGAPLGNAEVSYRIVRQGEHYWYRDEEDGDDIDEGDTETDANGNFAITFDAETDSDYDKDETQVFTYNIIADITDANGETRTGNYSVRVGTKPILLTIEMPADVNDRQKVTINLNSQNVNEQFLPVQGAVKIYKVNTPARLLLPRPWTAPELQTIPENEFVSLFPHLPYGDVKDSVITNKIYFSQDVNTEKSKNIKLPSLKKWDSGQYEVVFTAKDSLGNDVKTSQRFTITKDTEKVLPAGRIFNLEVLNKDFAKDGYVTLAVSSSLPVLYANLTANTNYKIIYNQPLTLKTGKTIVKIPVVKNPETVMNIELNFVWQNQLFSTNKSVTVLRDQEHLQIETSTLNSKLAPGSNQTWSVSVKGSKAQAEVLASMYDASLDQFAKDGWELLDVYSYLQNNLPQVTLNTQGDAKVFFNYLAHNPYKAPINDRLYTYGFNIVNSRNSRTEYSPKSQVKSPNDLTITGIVTEKSNGMPVPGVVVRIQGTNTGTMTDFDGRYTIYALRNEKIVFSYVGLKEHVITVNDNATVNVALEDNSDELKEVVVEGYRTTARKRSNVAVTTVSSETIEGRPNVTFVQSLSGQVPGLNISTGSGSPWSGTTTVTLQGTPTLNGKSQPLYIIDGVPLSEKEFSTLSESDILNITFLKDTDEVTAYGERGKNGVVIITTKKSLQELEKVQARKNFNETAFFYPQLTTDKKGSLSFSFTIPEALTKWKLRLLAHNKTAASTYLEKTFFTQKDLMVVPNMPRFLRESDTLTVKAKVTNMTAEPKTGNAMLQLFDAVTMQPADAQMLNTANMKPFTIAANGSTTVSWTIAVPTGLQGVQYKVLAKAGDFTDGEENILPVLTNSMLVTESMPLWVKPNTTKSFTLANLKNNTSTTLRNQGITLEYTSNPAWVALQSLPYLMEYEHECAEQVFSRYYANAIATHIIDSNPKIADVFAAWRKADKPLSKLEQNEELKSVILAESPWLLDSQSEEDKKNCMATLFELDKMKQNLEANLDKISKKQSASGAFPWFDGGTDNEYITRHILAGFGHLAKLGITPGTNLNALTKNGIGYLDNRFLADHKAFQKNLKKNETFRIVYPYDALHYLYTRSFYLKQYPLTDSLSAAIKPYLGHIKTHWLEYSLYEKGMAALVLSRFDDLATAKKIINSLKQTSALNEENGVYWIENKAGWYWYRAPIETQALLIEAFAEVTNDTESVDAMKVWLIKQKQNKNWPTTKSTSEAVYALLMQGTNWLSVKENTTFKLGDQKVFDTKLAESSKEAGTGYIKLNWKPEEVTKEMATLTVENKSAVPGYGGFYWQYFEDLDKIKPAQEGIMNIDKELYLKKNTTDGPQLQRVLTASLLQVGDLVTIRLVLTIKEDVEYVHLKDMRASAFEPVDVLSKYEYRDKLSYYRSTRDAATHFFFDNINKGTYVLEYDVRVNNAGEFSNGITTLQSMYAPEFSGHTKGVRVKTID